MKKKKNYFLLLFVVVIVLYFSLKDNFFDIIKQLKDINIFFFTLAGIFMIMYGLLRALSLYLIVKDTKYKFSFKNSITNILITQFFNTTTPFSSGGQPAQVYFLKQKGIPTILSTSVVIENFILYQLVLIIYGIIGIVLNNTLGYFPESSLLKKLVIIGFLCNTLVMIMLFIISFNKNGNRFILKKIINLLEKLKIVHNKEELLKKVNKKTEEFHMGAMNMKKNIKTTIRCIIINFVAFFFLYTIPLIVLYSTNNFNNFNILMCLSATSYTMLIGAFVPIPGGSGGIEYGFVEFFGIFINGALLSTILLLWRFTTYYITIPIGALALATLKKGEEK